MVVPVNSRTPGADKIDQLATVGGGEHGTVRRGDKKGRAANRAKRADGRVDAARDKLLRAFEKLFRVSHECETG